MFYSSIQQWTQQGTWGTSRGPGGPAGGLGTKSPRSWSIFKVHSLKLSLMNLNTISLADVRCEWFQLLSAFVSMEMPSKWCPPCIAMKSRTSRLQFVTFDGTGLMSVSDIALAMSWQLFSGLPPQSSVVCHVSSGVQVNIITSSYSHHVNHTTEPISVYGRSWYGCRCTWRAG